MIIPIVGFSLPIDINSVGFLDLYIFLDQICNRQIEFDIQLVCQLEILHTTFEHLLRPRWRQALPGIYTRQYSQIDWYQCKISWYSWLWHSISLLIGKLYNLWTFIVTTLAQALPGATRHIPGSTARLTGTSTKYPGLPGYYHFAKSTLFTQFNLNSYHLWLCH